MSDLLEDALAQAEWAENRMRAQLQEAEVTLRNTPWYHAPIKYLRLWYEIRKARRQVLADGR